MLWFYMSDVAKLLLIVVSLSPRTYAVRSYQTIIFVLTNRVSNYLSVEYVTLLLFLFWVARQTLL